MTGDQREIWRRAVAEHAKRQRAGRARRQTARSGPLSAVTAPGMVRVHPPPTDAPADTDSTRKWHAAGTPGGRELPAAPRPAQTEQSGAGGKPVTQARTGDASHE